jgi:hypothetical protein
MTCLKLEIHVKDFKISRKRGFTLQINNLQTFVVTFLIESSPDKKAFIDAFFTLHHD